MTSKNKEKLIEKLEVKNKFITSLRDHLQEKYETKQVYTFGEGDSIAKIDEGSYSLVNRTENEPIDISGFCFRKDLMNHKWTLRRKDIHQTIHEFSKTQENIKSHLNISKKENHALKHLRPKKREGINLDRYAVIDHDIQLGKDKYSILVYIGEGYAGSIDIQFRNKI